MQSSLQAEIDTIRSFNRYYTKVLGLLNQNILDSPYSLSEVRTLREIAGARQCTSKYLSETLSMDAGYLSRMLTRFQRAGLLEKQKSGTDGRSYTLSLTDTGKTVYAALNASSDQQIRALLEPLSQSERARLVESMAAVKHILERGRELRPEDVTIRHGIRSGDAGYITYLHGWIYRQEHGYGTAFEAYVAQSFYEFLLHYDAARDRLWLAEHHGRIVGCIGIVGHGERAQLRWFLLHPDYRGLGLGGRLLRGALDFCRGAGYRSVYLETTSDLEQAVRMYEKAGFVKVSERENHTWRDDLTELEFAMEL